MMGTHAALLSLIGNNQRLPTGRAWVAIWQETGRVPCQQSAQAHLARACGGEDAAHGPRLVQHRSVIAPLEPCLACGVGSKRGAGRGPDAHLYRTRAAPMSHTPTHMCLPVAVGLAWPGLERGTIPKDDAGMRPPVELELTS